MDNNVSEVVLIEEVRMASDQLRKAMRGLSLGALFKLIRKHLGISQKRLSELAGVPQSTISSVEKGARGMSLSTLNKIAKALSCDLLVAPALHHSIENLRRKQAIKIAEKRVKYLKGTMNLEDQQPDQLFIEELLKNEMNRLLQGPSSDLWEE